MLSQIAADPIRRLVGLVAGSTTLRQFLTVTTLAIGVAATTAAPAAAETRTLELYYVHTKERVSITFKKDGRYVPGGLQQLNRTLRDWRRNEVTRMDPALFDLVWEVWKASGSRQPLNVVSAYRSPATNNMLRSRTRGVAKFSQHMLGKAMDFYVPDVSITQLRQIAMKKQVGGVGFYPTANTPFVHLDTGNVRAWPRMSRPQLMALFPDGRTLHVPADGKPLPGYQEALVAYQARKGKSGGSAGATMMASSGRSGSSASYSSGDDGGVVRPVGSSGGKGLLAMIFGGGADEAEDNADEESGYAQAPAERSTTRSRMPVNVAAARQATGADDEEGGGPIAAPASRQSLPGVSLSAAPPVTPAERATAAAVAAPPPPAPVPVAAPEAPKAAPVLAAPAPVAPAPIPTAAPAAPVAPAPVIAAEPAPAAPVPQAAPIAPTVVARTAPAMPVPAPAAPEAVAAAPEAEAPPAVVVASVLPRPRPADLVAPAEAAEAVNVATANVPLPLPAAPGRAELARLAAATPAAPPPVMGYANAGEGVVQPGTTDIFAETANALAATRKASTGAPGAADQAVPVGALPPATTLAAVASGGLAGYTPARKTRPDPLAAFLTAPDRDDTDLLNGSATLRTVVFAEFTPPVHAGLGALLDAPPVAYQLGFAQRGGLSPRTDRFMGPAIVSLAVLPID